MALELVCRAVLVQPTLQDEPRPPSRPKQLLWGMGGREGDEEVGGGGNTHCVGQTNIEPQGGPSRVQQVSVVIRARSGAFVGQNAPG